MSAATVTATTATSLISCQSQAKKIIPPAPFNPLAPSSEDALKLVPGLSYEILIKYDTPINNAGEKFGFNNDYIAYIGTKNDGIIMVNHEYNNPLFVSGFDRQGKLKKTKTQFDKERASLGVSLLKITKEKSKWSIDLKSKYNKRIHGGSKIPIIADREIVKNNIATGTMANCAGGITPWGTFLTCEENYNHYYGEWKYDSKGNKAGKQKRNKTYNNGWDQFENQNPEQYGWVVEVNPKTGTAKKLTSLGRFSHESATVTLSKDGYPVVYTGDDKANEYLYKFVSSQKKSLEKGELFVANTKKGKWISLDINKQPKLKENFKDQTEVLIRARAAARLLGATELDRPEDIEIEPKTNTVFVALTNNITTANAHGSILKLEETNADAKSLTFKASKFLTGGLNGGLSCPDNLAFDANGNLWVTTDISDKLTNQFPYSKFKNNGLFYVPMSGANAGRAMQVASAPNQAEFTGICFLPDNKTLLLSVQHPGGATKKLSKPTSHWPHGGKNLPKPAVVAITGELMDKLLG